MLQHDFNSQRRRWEDDSVVTETFFRDVDALLACELLVWP